jgi:hypothetical protein
VDAGVEPNNPVAASVIRLAYLEKTRNYHAYALALIQVLLHLSPQVSSRIRKGASPASRTVQLLVRLSPQSYQRVHQAS